MSIYVCGEKLRSARLSINVCTRYLSCFFVFYFHKIWAPAGVFQMDQVTGKIFVYLTLVLGSKWISTFKF